MNAQCISLDDTRRRIRQAWSRYVLPAYTSHDSATLLAALVVANTGMDDILLAENCAGETAADRLRSARESFSNYADLRTARHTRDMAVHQLGYPICRRTVLPALGCYAIALWEHSVDLSAPWP
jgi:hypothetical protein